MPSNIRDLAQFEAGCVERSIGDLGTSFPLLNQLESAYESLTPLVSLPDNFVDDEDFARLAVIHEFELCRVLLTKAGLASLRRYQADVMIHLRRAIEACAFAHRMSRHPHLAKTWLEGGTSAADYQAYRKAFRPPDVFQQDEKHSDYDPLIDQLREKSDLCSKSLHGSIIGMAGHYASEAKTTANGRPIVTFTDMPEAGLPSIWTFLLQTHVTILFAFSRIFLPFAKDLTDWNSQLSMTASAVINLKLQPEMSETATNASIGEPPT